LHTKTRQHVNQAVRAEQVNPTALQVADARLGDAQDLGCLGLREPPRREGFLQLD
jgi:hypothetical protein